MREVRTAVASDIFGHTCRFRNRDVYIYVSRVFVHLDRHVNTEICITILLLKPCCICSLLNTPCITNKLCYSLLNHHYKYDTLTPTAIISTITNHPHYNRPTTPTTTSPYQHFFQEFVQIFHRSSLRHRDRRERKNARKIR